MEFLIRTISHSAEGREIVRTARVDGDRLSIGRAPENNIHLTDLAVALRHVAIQRVDSRLVVTVEHGLSVELNGRKVTQGEIELAAGADILLASHVLRIMPTAPGSGEISINVERVTSSEVTLDRNSERMFSLAPVMPGKRIAAWLFSLLILGLFLAWPIKVSLDRQQRTESFERFRADALWSSGHLSAAHAGLKSNCTACHVKPFEAVRDASCKSCHAAIHDHADPFRLARAQPDLGRWDRFTLNVKERFNLPPGRCVDCHTEHEGPQVMPVTAQRFCSDCHAGLSSKLPDTPIADAGDFGRSHPEFQPALVTRWSANRPVVQRMSLAARPQEDSGLKFPHALHVSRTSGVAQMARRLGADHGFGAALECKDCHAPTPDGTRFEPVNMEQDCAMCHSLALGKVNGRLRTLPHGDPGRVITDLRGFYRGQTSARPASLAPAARRRPGDVMAIRQRVQFSRGATGSAEHAIRAVFSPGGACFDCHQIRGGAGGSIAFSVDPVELPVRYLQHGWFDHRAHRTATCTSCHAAEASASSADLLLPSLASCRSCHGGESSAKAVPSSCAMCHDYHMDKGAPEMLIRRRAGGTSKLDPRATGARLP